MIDYFLKGKPIRYGGMAKHMQNNNYEDNNQARILMIFMIQD